MRGPLRWARTWGAQNRGEAPSSSSLRSSTSPRTRGEVKTSDPVPARAPRARVMSNSVFCLPPPLAGSASHPPERATTSCCGATLRGSPPADKREAERRQTRAVPPARIRRAGRATEGAACAAPSAIGRARLPAFHLGSSQGVCGPLVRSGPGFVGKPSKGRGSLRRRSDHFQRRTSHAGRNAGRHDARTARERS